MITLGIETSCDETAVAVVEDGFTLRANLIASQVHLHERFGGVVPEVAARAHVEALNPLMEEALARPRSGSATSTRSPSPWVPAWWEPCWWAWQRPRAWPSPPGPTWWG